MRIGLVPNLTKDKDGRITESIAAEVKARDMDVYIKPPAKEHFSGENSFSDKDFYEKADIIIVLGGDGTLLHSARKAAVYRKPILGLNLGRLGFLTEGEISDSGRILAAISSGNYHIESRMMVSAELYRDGKLIYENSALNEIAIAKGSFARIIHLDAYINEEYAGSYSADGLLISSPTGSTAYSLSAGGPVIQPGVMCLLLTPICPHSLNSRPIIVDSSSQVKINITDKNSDILLTVDGQEGTKLTEGDTIIAGRSQLETQLIRINDYRFFDILRSKLTM